MGFFCPCLCPRSTLVVNTMVKDSVLIYAFFLTKTSAFLTKLHPIGLYLILVCVSKIDVCTGGLKIDFLLIT